MANIRIKDLATTASSTASDDFIAVDGTTNGTRKLSAFSPTFGGNATVTGTLTVNGAATFNATAIISSAGIANAHLTINNTFGKEVRLYSGIVGTNNNGFSVRNETNTTDWLTIDGSGNVKVPATTASTTTSTGALVVGNGTSGGLGVGGAASIGGPILVGTSSDVYLSRTGAGVLDLRSASTPGTVGRLDINGTTSAVVGFRQTGSRDWFITAESFELRVSCLTAASIFAFNSGTPVRMRDTTASTSTSSGALVVSGGVGVAGAIYAGGGVVISGSTGGSVIGGRQWSFKANGSGDSPASGCVIRDDSAAADRLTIDINGDSVFAGSLKTSAPAGGTAAAWKLGTVATVSPTSPNRTIEVDIGGTIYYLAAKTTNN